MFILIPLGIITLIGIVYLAVSRKSSSMVRFAALGALALMIITVIVCLLIIFGVIETSSRKVIVMPDAVSSAVPAAPGPNIVTLVVVIVFLLALFMLVFILSMREQKRIQSKKSW